MIRPGLIVGRAAETARLGTLVRGALTGRGGAVVVEGEPGIGKSTMLDFAAAECADAGARVLRCAAQRTDRHLPFATLMSCPELAVVDRTGGSGYAITEAIVDLIGDACADQAQALVVDDLQWADAASLVVLHRLGLMLRRVSLLLLTAARPTPRDPGLEVLLRGLRARDAEFVTLDGLDPAAVAELAGALVGAPPGLMLTELLAGAAGNPLYLIDLVTTVLRVRQVTITDGVADMISVDVSAESDPDGPGGGLLAGLRLDGVAGRLDFLTTEARKVLAVAALMGRELAVTDLSAVLEMPTVDLWAELADAWANGLLVESGDGLRFRHDLVRQAIIDDLPPTMAAALRTQIGLALAGRNAAPERVAAYLFHDRRLDPRAVDWLLGVAPPLMLQSPQTAVRLLGRTLTMEAADDPRRRRLRRAQVEALLWAGQPAQAAEVATELMRSGGEADRPALGMLLAQALFAQGRPAEAADQALRTVDGPGAPEVEVARARAFVSECRLFLGDLDAAAELATAAGTDPADGRTVAAAARLVQGRLPEALALLDGALATAVEQPTRPRHAKPHLLRALCLSLLDRHAEADDVLRVALAQAGARRSLAMPVLWDGWLRWTRAVARFLNGRWDDALAECSAMVRVDGDEASPDHLGISQPIASLAAQIRIRRGDLGPHTAWDCGDLTPAGRAFGAWPVWADALAVEAAGQPAVALQRLAACWEQGVGLVPPHSSAQVCADLVRLWLTLGWDDRGPASRPERSGPAGSAGQHGRSGALTGMAAVLAAMPEPAPSARTAARLCAGAAQLDADLVAGAAEECGRAGRPLDAAVAWECAALILARSGPASDAVAALDNALEGYDRLGAVWDRERALRQLAGRGVRPSRRAGSHGAGGWESLTETESRIAELVAAGLSTSQIVAEVFLSRRSVQLHLARALDKLGLRSRVELVRAARDRHGTGAR